jgi:hypothetical protein
MTDEVKDAGERPYAFVGEIGEVADCTRATWTKRPYDRSRIYDEIEAERMRQLDKHGFQLDLPIVLEADRKLVDDDQYIKRIFGLRQAKGNVSQALIALEEFAEMVHAGTLEECEREAIEAATCLVQLVEAIRWQRAKGKVGA